MDSVVEGDDAQESAPGLMGRTAQIARLHAVVDGLPARRGALVDIAGDPGVGKTALLDFLATRARAGDVAVHRARAVDQPSVAYQVLRDTWPTPDLPPPDADDDARFRFGRAVHARLSSLARSRPTALILDDVHLCDAASVDLLAQLVRTPVPGPFILALAHRPRQTSPKLLDALAHATAADGLVRLEPDRLDERSFAALVAAWRLPEAAGPALYEAAGGNPRYAAILTRAGWRADAWPEHTGTTADRLLRAGSTLVAELARLDAAASAVVLAAAVLGDGFTADDAAAVSGLGDTGSSAPDEARDALGRLAARDLVRPLGTGARFA
ncbi:MAG: AAA family ATPase, partial [Actinocrinis sp.]